MMQRKSKPTLINILIVLAINIAEAEDRTLRSRSYIAPTTSRPFIDSQLLQKYIMGRNETKDTFQPRTIPINDRTTTYDNGTRNLNNFKYNKSDTSDTSRITRRTLDVSNDADKTAVSEARGKLKKYKKYMLPLLIAYKLKFFTLIPLMMGGLVLLAGSTGLAGFFFALFAATMGLRVGNH